jgi:ketosteroid isomerase-like protein
MKKSIVILLSALSYVACKQNSTSTNNLAEAKKEIAESNITYWQAFVKADSSLFIERYAEDACIMPPNVPAICGNTAAPAFFKVAWQQMGIRNGKFTTTEVFGGSEEYVTENGLFELRDSVNKLIDNGKYLVLWKKTAAGWKMFRDSFSSDNTSVK